MGNRETTHVLEIETGIGEPAFVPLSLGEELAPISVGRKGMWRIESARVLDVHAFVYFDGEVAFIQSADERAPALVDGRAVGQAWTELAVGSRIEVGQARLRFRSLLAPLDDTGETQAFDRNAARLPPPTPSAADVIPPKPERPFRPGELAPPLDESTRIQPVESAVRNIPEAARASHPNFVQGPDAAPISVPPISSHPLMASGMGPALPPMHTPYPGQVVPMTPPGTGMHYATGGYPGAPGGMIPPGPGSVPPPFGPGSVPPHASYPPPVAPGPPGPPAGEGEKDLAAKWKEMPLPRRLLILMSPLFLVSAYYTFFEDAPPPPKTTRAAKDAGAEVVASVRPSATAAPVAMPAVPPAVLPGPGEPTPVPVAPTGVATAPTGVAAAPVATAPTGVAAAPVAVPPPAPPAPAGATAGKTYERLAIDAYLAGDYATSARLYAQLAEQTQPPSNIVYQEAARIIRAKLDAGAPR